MVDKPLPGDRIYMFTMFDPCECEQVDYLPTAIIHLHVLVYHSWFMLDELRYIIASSEPGWRYSTHGLNKFLTIVMYFLCKSERAVYRCASGFQKGRDIKSS
jgi:hypothetical protein